MREKYVDEALGSPAIVTSPTWEGPVDVEDPYSRFPSLTLSRSDAEAVVRAFERAKDALKLALHALSDPAAYLRGRRDEVLRFRVNRGSE